MGPVRWLFSGFLILVGLALLNAHTMLGIALIALGALVIWASSRSRKSPQPLPAPSEHRSARIEARRIERDAERKAERIVAKAVGQADERGRAAIHAAQVQLAAEAAQKWVV